MRQMQTIFNTLIHKIKPLDWVIIVISTSILVFLVISSINKERWITIEFKVTNSPTYFPNNGGGDAPFWVADNIREGDVQYDNIGNKNLKILSIKQWGYQNRETWVTATVKAKYKPKQKKYTFVYQPLEIGRSIDITINGSNIHGIVSSIQGFSDTRPIKIITVKARLVDTLSTYSIYTRGVEPWVAQSIDKKAVINDLYGRVSVSLDSIEIKPAERVSTTYDGRVILAEDPIKKDVYMTLRLRVTKQNDTYMFLEDKPILIGASIPLYFSNMALYPVITEILEEQ